jgi:hypothetical protein
MACSLKRTQSATVPLSTDPEGREHDVAAACPSCGRACGSSVSFCASCGFALQGALAARLRDNASRQWQLVAERARIDDEQRRLAHEQTSLLSDVTRAARAGATVTSGQAGPASASPLDPTHELSISSVRSALLWTGASLLAFSGLGFGGYEWTHLGPTGRATALGAAAALVLAATPFLRRRIPMTAEAVGSLGLTLTVIDWALLRRGGIGTSLSPEAWWALGALVVVSLGIALGVVGVVAGRVAAAVAFVAAVPLSVSVFAPLFASAGAKGSWRVPCLSGIAVLDVVVARLAWPHPRWRVSAQLIVAGAMSLTVWTYAACVALVEARSVTAIVALAIASTASAPFTLRVLFGARLKGTADVAPAEASLHQQVVLAVLSAVVATSVLGAILYVLSGLALGDQLAPVTVGLGALLLLGAARVALPDRQGLRVVALGAITVGSVGAVAVTLAAPGSWAATVCLASSAFVVVALSWIDGEATLELGMLATGTAVIGGAVALVASMVALVGPMGWWRSAWIGSTSLPVTHVGGPATLTFHPTTGSLAQLGLIAVVLVLTVATIGRSLPAHTRVCALAAICVLGAVDVPFAFGLRIGDAVAIDFVTGTALVGVAAVAGWRRRGETALTIVPAVMGAVVAASFLGWCAATPTSTIVGLAIALGWAVVVAASSRRTSLGEAGRVVGYVMMLALVGCASAARHAPPSTIGTLVVIVASCLLVLDREPWIAGAGASRASRAITETLVLVGVGVPALNAHLAPTWMSHGLDTTIAVVALSVASIRPGRVSYRYAAALFAVVATWCWLAAAHVTLVEAYTWPAAVVLVAVGGVLRHTRRLEVLAVSWLAYGPGLLFALGPSTGLAIASGGAARLSCVTALGLLVIVAGARSRLQAPLLLGVASMLAVAVDVALPVLKGLPTWLLAGIAGAVLLWLGATAERRVAAARRVLERVAHLG